MVSHLQTDIECSPYPQAAVHASQRRQLNVPLDSDLVDALKSRAAEEGVTLSKLVQGLLSAAMEGWEASPNIAMRLEDHERRLNRIEALLLQPHQQP